MHHCSGWMSCFFSTFVRYILSNRPRQQRNLVAHRFYRKVSIVYIDIDLLSAATPFNFYRLASATVLRFYLRHKINVCQHNYCHLIKVVMLRRIRFFVMPNGYLVHFPHDTAPGSPPELNRWAVEWCTHCQGHRQEFSRRGLQASPGLPPIF